MSVVHANGAAIPSIGLGTWQLSGADCVRAVEHALGIGYRHLDTAAMYGNEEAVGEGLRASGLPRDEVFVTTKVWYTDLKPGDLERSAEASLKRLGLDAVDLLLIHWPNPQMSLDGPIRALCEAKRRGLARHVGVSNFTVALLDEAVRLATEPLVANQCEYHPYLDQSAGARRLPQARPRLRLLQPARPRRPLDDPIIREIAEAHGRTPGADRAALARAAAGRRRDPEVRHA